MTEGRPNQSDLSATRIRTTAQAGFQVRLDWGPTGGAAIANGADIAVVVDVLSFTTTLSIAVGQGTRVFPFPWKDERAAAFAAEKEAVLAVGRLEARGLADPPPSLSPAQLLSATPVPRLVLPSPNGSALVSTLAALAPRPAAIVGAALRNRSAVARWLQPRIDEGAVVALLPAGERWPDGSLRPALEDLWGAGAVLAALDLTGRAVSPEARHAASSYSVELAGLASARELEAMGYAEDVVAASALDVDDVVPLLTGDEFVAG